MAGNKKKNNQSSNKVKPASGGTTSDWAFLIPVLIITFFLFSSTLKNHFIINWDDDGYIINNPFLKDFSWNGIVAMFSQFHLDNYHPLTTFSNAIEYNLFGLNPKPYHFINLVLHLLNTCFVFYFIKQLLKNKEAAIIVALLFAIHPMHVESVAWISERKDLLYTAFFLSSMIIYNRFLQEGKSSLLFWSVVLMLLSCLSKSAAVALTPVLFLLDYHAGKKISMQSVLQKVPFILLSLLFGVLALLSQGGSGSMNMVEQFPLFDKILFFFYGLSFYLVKLILPFNLSSMYLYPIKDDGWFPLEYYLAPLFIIAIILLVYRSKNIRKELLFGLLFYLFTIGMVIQVVPVGKAIVAERYAYVPYIGLFFIVAKLYLMVVKNEVKNAAKYKSVLYAVLASFILLFSIGTWNRSKEWKDSHSLFTSIIEQQPDNYYGYYARAVGLSLQHNTESSIVDYSAAIKRDSSHGFLWYNRGVELEKLKRKEEAIIDYTNAIKVDSLGYKPFYNRGNLRFGKGDFAGAISDYSQTILLNSTYAEAYCNRAIVNLKIRDTIQAYQDFSDAIVQNPTLINALTSRGALYFKQGKMNEACADYYAAIEAGSVDAQKIYDYYCKPAN